MARTRGAMPRPPRRWALWLVFVAMAGGSIAPAAKPSAPARPDPSRRFRRFTPADGRAPGWTFESGEKPGLH